MLKSSPSSSAAAAAAAAVAAAPEAPEASTKYNMQTCTIKAGVNRKKTSFDRTRKYYISVVACDNIRCN